MSDPADTPAPVLTPRLPPASSASARKVPPFTLVLVTLLGAAFGFAAAKLGAEALHPLPGRGWKLGLAATLPLVWFIGVAVHELGHLIGGWLVGGRFLLWCVGPVKVWRAPAGIRLGWNRSLNIFGGLAACLPAEPGRWEPRHVATMIVAGPLASLVFGLGLLLAVTGRELDPAGAVLPAFLYNFALVTGGMSLLLAVVTIWPSAGGGFKSDGKRVWELLRRSPRSDQEAALLLLTSASLAGIRPADYDPELVRRALALNDGSLFDRYARFTIYFHAADRAEWGRAQELLDAVVAGEENLPAYLRAAVRCEYAWLLATGAGDAVTARAWLDSAGPLEFDPATRLRAEAAVLAAEHRQDEARAKAQAALEALHRRTLGPVRSPFVEDAIRQILDRV